MIEGFTRGFEIGYRGNRCIKLKSRNIKLECGSQLELWNKTLKEVRLGRFAGPFKDEPPFEFFIQSPVGLVPKGDGHDTRLIFHLSPGLPRFVDHSRTFQPV